MALARELCSTRAMPDAVGRTWLVTWWVAASLCSLAGCGGKASSSDSSAGPNVPRQYAGMPEGWYARLGLTRGGADAETGGAGDAGRDGDEAGGTRANGMEPGAAAGKPEHAESVPVKGPNGD